MPSARASRTSPSSSGVRSASSRLGAPLGRLVEEQHAAVGQRDRARPGHPAAAADQRGHRAGVVRRHERRHRAQRCRRPGSRPATDRIAASASASSGGEPGQQPDEPLREHRLAGARRADQQHVVAAGGGDLQRVPGVVLPDDVGEVGRLRPRVVGERAGPAQLALASRRKPSTSARLAAPSTSMPVDQRGLVAAPPPAPPPGASRPRARRAGTAARRGPGAAGRRGPARRAAPCRPAPPAPTTPPAPRTAQASARSKPLPALRRLAGRQGEHDPLVGPGPPGVDDRGAHPVLRLVQRGVGQPDQVEPGSPPPTSASISTTWPSTPSRATDHARASAIRTPPRSAGR